jgi:hypothetical protein
LVGDDGLERVVEPFPEGMDKAGAVGADGAGAYWSFMDFYCQIEVSERVESVFLNPIADVASSILGEA